jgi:hypothetical protein
MDVSSSSDLRRLIAGELAIGDLTIMTFNYDLLLEQVLDEIAKGKKDIVFCFPGCYLLNRLLSVFPGHTQFIYDSDRLRPGSRFTNCSTNHDGVELLKLHGSLGWVHLVNEEDNMRGRIHGRGLGSIYAIDSKDILGEMPRWEYGGHIVTLAPAIVPPMPHKEQALSLPAIADIWELAKKRLAKATRLTIAGYSIPTSDLEVRDLLIHNVSPRPS